MTDDTLQHARTIQNMASGSPPPATCPIGWQPQALAPVFYGARSLGPPDGAPVPLRIFFPSLDGAVETAPLLAGCGHYPLIVFCHGHCQGDTNHYRRWFRLPAQLARSGYVVVVPHLAGIAGGQSPSVAAHPDLPTLDAVVTWARSGWEHAEVLMPPPATGVVGHSYGAMLGARYASNHRVTAYAGLSGGWGDWFGDALKPLRLLGIPNFLTWGGPSDLFTQLSETEWNQIRTPRHRAVFAKGEHWDYLAPTTVPCGSGIGVCPRIGPATDDLVTMFFGRYLPPELATDLPARVPSSLVPPPLVLTPEQEFFAGSFLTGYAGLPDSADCKDTLTTRLERLVANRRSKETHSLEHPCSFVNLISSGNRVEVSARPPGYHWCDFCFPARRDG
jgi:pimeloyl-ACP methyl ester carboxylesterase